MSIKLIVAVSQEWGIGANNDLLFHIPDDLKRFKELTVGNNGEPNLVLMGSKTYQSLPVDKLPNRINVVLTRNKDLETHPEVFKVDSIDHVLNHYNSGNQNRDLFCIGGSTTYSHVLPHADEVHLTYIDKAAENADTFFNRKLLEEHFYMTSFKKKYCEKNELDYYYVDYKNKKHFTHRWDELK